MGDTGPGRVRTLGDRQETPDREKERRGLFGADRVRGKVTETRIVYRDSVRESSLSNRLVTNRYEFRVYLETVQSQFRCHIIELFD